ncbi:MAG: hypothetical protein C4530_01565 [Desulfobacteraceae bacterium]|nr:MAG: hypothetical protein C4530_01565 [Desulfobacteraceae bacterium]
MVTRIRKRIRAKHGRLPFYSGDRQVFIDLVFAHVHPEQVPLDFFILNLHRNEPQYASTNDTFFFRLRIDQFSPRSAALEF